MWALSSSELNNQLVNETHAKAYVRRLYFSQLMLERG
jgi:hypothetical protein